MKYLILLFIGILASCTSNTIYEKPKDLIPKDTMILLLEDMYIASIAKTYKNKNSEKNIDYTHLLYEKYNIDSTRFKSSNIFYTSQIDKYEKLIKTVKERIDERLKVEQLKDSVSKPSEKQDLDDDNDITR